MQMTAFRPLKKEENEENGGKNIGLFDCEGSGGAAHLAGTDTFLCRVHTVLCCTVATKAIWCAQAQGEG